MNMENLQYSKVQQQQHSNQSNHPFKLENVHVTIFAYNRRCCHLGTCIVLMKSAEKENGNERKRQTERKREWERTFANQIKYKWRLN